MTATKQKIPIEIKGGEMKGYARHGHNALVECGIFIAKGLAVSAHIRFGSTYKKTKAAACLFVAGETSYHAIMPVMRGAFHMMPNFAQHWIGHTLKAMEPSFMTTIFHTGTLAHPDAIMARNITNAEGTAYLLAAGVATWYAVKAAKALRAYLRNDPAE